MEKVLGLNLRQGTPGRELVVWQLNWLYKLEVQWKLTHFKINCLKAVGILPACPALACSQNSDSKDTHITTCCHLKI